MKVRVEQESNYKGIWLSSGKTLRFALDPTKPVTELKYPEFLDISLTNFCNGGCKECYQNSTPQQPHFQNVTNRLRTYFSSIPKESRPFQIAYGGGEPTSHPEFNSVMRMTKEEFDICPNFTTNGLWVKEDSSFCKEHLSTVKTFCGGVAVTNHRHLEKFWRNVAIQYLNQKIPLNFHYIISDKESIDTFLQIYEEWKPFVDYFVLLPIINIGRAINNTKQIDYDYLAQVFPKENSEQIAFGALFYPFLKEHKLNTKVSLYEPEMFSKYLSLKDNGTLYSSSFSNVPLKENVLSTPKQVNLTSYF
jgi:hypothetical protein